MTIVDMHCNLLSPAEDQEIMAGMRRRNAAGDPAECTVDRTLARLDENGIASAVVWKIGRSAAECRQHNDFVAEAAAEHPDRFIPFATVFPPDVEKALEEIDRAILELGMAGVKVHPNVMDFSLKLPEVLAVVERVGELDIPFVTHVNPTRTRDLPDATRGETSGEPDTADRIQRKPNSDAELLKEIVSTFDSPRFQSAHMGGVDLGWARASHVSFQTTGGSVEVIQWALDNLGADRIVFGSDFPFFLVEDELTKVQRLEASDDVKAKILSGNALTRVLNERP